MDSSLDNIWDEPVINDEAPASNTSQTPLFMADSDDDDMPGAPSSRGTRKAPVNIDDIDIDAMFAEVENDEDDPFNFKPITPVLDTEALTREAEARHKARLPSYTPHAILPSSSPPRDMGNDMNGKSKGNPGEKGNAPKERRKPVRLDEGMLLSPSGFPQLIKDAKNFKIKGKGHEATDLNRLLQVYQFWTHRMYPKTQFRDSVERIEKLCHSKRMNVALSVWRDESHGRNINKEAEDDETIDLTTNEDLGITDNEQPNPSVDSALNLDGAASSSRPPSYHSSSGTEFDDDDFDLDAIIRDEEERRMKEQAESNNSKGKEKENTAIPAKDSHDSDDVMWNELDALEGESRHISENVVNPAIRRVDDDEEMWDIVREMEDTAASSAVSNPPNPVVVPPEPLLDDDNYEDMYI